MDSWSGCAARAAGSSSAADARRVGSGWESEVRGRSIGGQSLGARERLTASGDFRRVFRRGVRLDGPHFLLVASANECGHHRLGLAASRKLGGAVARNRAKRLLRESFRRNKPEARVGLDLILVPKREIVCGTFAEVEREYRERLRRLLARRGFGGSGADPAPGD